jgi:omega-amidase
MMNIGENAAAAPHSNAEFHVHISSTMQAHLVQFDIAWEDPQRNFDLVADMLDKASVQEGDLILLPEMFDSGFSFNVERNNDKSGRTLAFLLELADDHKAIVQGGRTVAPCGACAGHNVMTVVAPGQRVLTEYTKIHPFQREAQRFESGTTIETFAWNDLTVCPAICYDLRFPELFRAGLLKGAQAFTVGACWPAVRAHHWRALLIARAIENQAYAFGVNRTGKDPMATYAGGTIAIGPRGDILGELGDAPGVLSVPVSLAEVASWRESFFAWKDGKLLAHFKVP